MKHLKTYEGLNMGSYYDPPDNDDPLYEGVMDRVWSMFEDDGYDNDIVEAYLEYLENSGDRVAEISNIIHNTENGLVIDDMGNYPWSEEVRKQYDHKTYGRETYRKQKNEIEKRLQIEIAKVVYKELDSLYPIDDFIVRYNAEKYNL